MHGNGKIFQLTATAEEFQSEQKHHNKQLLQTNAVWSLNQETDKCGSR